MAKHLVPDGTEIGTHTPTPEPARRGLLPVLLVAQLMVILDITAVNIALPRVAADLNLGGSSVSWTITSYSLIFGSLLLLGGRAADLLGRRRMFFAGLSIFTVSSLASALAGTAGLLFAARAGQGVGAALLSPAALSIITTTFQEERRAKALAAWGGVGGAGAAVGVLVGGLLTQFADWRMIFYVNLPVAALLCIAAVRVVPADKRRPRWSGLDARGAVLAVTGLAGIVFSITQAESVGWSSLQTHVFGLGGVLALVAFVALEQRVEMPLLRVDRLAGRAVAGGLALMLMAAGAIFGLFLLCSLYLQNVLAADPFMTGLAFVPLAMSAGVGAHAAGHVVAKHGVRGPLSTAFLISAVGMFLLSRVSDHGTYVGDVLPGMLVAGLGLGVAVVAVSISILGGSQEEDAGMLSGVSATGHEVGGTLGVAVFSTVAAGASGALLGPQSASGIGAAFGAAALVVALAAAAAATILPRSRDFLPVLQASPHAMRMH